MGNKKNIIKKIRTALISVSDKSNLNNLLKALKKNKIKLISSGGTYKAIKKLKFSCIEVSDFSESPEVLDGRVKTLHPKIHGALLGRRGIDDAVMEEHEIKAIDLVVVNLYPFEEAVSKKNCTFENAIENIDIGGPTMVRAAAKNFKNVTICQLQPNNDFFWIRNLVLERKK